MTLKFLVIFPLCFAIGCVAAPREVETTIDLGPQKVEIDVRLHDIRTSGNNALTQLQLFSEFSKWDPKWIEELPWAVAPTRFEYASDGGRLDLSMHGTMSRADFDKCARAAYDAGVCNEFPVMLSKSGYGVRPEVLQLASLTIDPKAKAAWPADAGRMSYRVALSPKEEQFIKDGPSLAEGFELHRANPAAADATVKKMEAAESLFVKGSIADWQKELAELEACTEQPWCKFRRESVRRDQTRLVYGYLSKRPEAGAAIKGAPSRHLDFLDSSLGGLVPKDPLPLVDDLRMRILYDVQLDDFREQGWLGSDPWAAVCRPDTMKKPSLKDFCARLGVKAKK